MTSQRHAADTRDEIQRLRLKLQSMCENSILGVAPTSADLHSAFVDAGLAEYCACRTMVAIDCGARRGSDRDPRDGVDRVRRCAVATGGAR